MSAILGVNTVRRNSLALGSTPRLPASLKRVGESC